MNVIGVKSSGQPLTVVIQELQLHTALDGRTVIAVCKNMEFSVSFGFQILGFVFNNIALLLK